MKDLKWMLVGIGAIVIAVVLTTAVALSRGAYGPAHQLPGVYEGQGAITIGCALNSVPQQSDEYPGDPHDFLLSVDREEMMLIVIHQGHSYLLDGKQCGYSIDWRAFPQEERQQDMKIQ